jgi:hypothetical protein
MNNGGAHASLLQLWFQFAERQSPDLAQQWIDADAALGTPNVARA